MNTHPELIVMLTYNDVTVPQAAEVFAKCEHTRARYWGFKEAVSYTHLTLPTTPYV